MTTPRRWLFLRRHRHCSVVRMSDWRTWGYLCRDHERIWSA